MNEYRYDSELAGSLCTAIAAFESVLPLITKTLGPNHPDLLNATVAMTNLRQELEAQGYYPRLQ